MGVPQRKAAFVASIYLHFTAFHLPYIRLLQNEGFEVHAYASPDEGKAVLEKEGVVCHDISVHRSPFHKENIDALKQLTVSFREENIYLAHVHTPVAGVLGRIAAKRASVPYVIYTAHGFHFYKGAPLLNWLLYYPLERYMARYTDILITINEEDFRRAKQFPVRKYVTYMPGVGLNVHKYGGDRSSYKKKLMRKRLYIDEESFVITCIAELNENKNQIQLIEAVKRMVNRGENVHCLLIGSGERERQLKEKVTELMLDSHIQFLGSRRDIPELLALSDVVALVSKREGLSRALMEAMAAGKPIVATDIRGNRDLVKHRKNGFLVPVADSEATANALSELYNKPLMRKTMGAINEQEALKYDVDRIAQEMEKLYCGDFYTSNPIEVSV